MYGCKKGPPSIFETAFKPEPKPQAQSKPGPAPETYHRQIDGYDVEVNTWTENLSLRKYTTIAAVGSLQVANEITHDEKVNLALPPQVKAIESAANQKCPKGYTATYKNWSDTASVRYVLMYACNS